jgi:hypothetical protein
VTDQTIDQTSDQAIDPETVPPAAAETVRLEQGSVTVQNVEVEGQAPRPETLAEVVARTGITDPDSERGDPAAALFDANRGRIGSEPANTAAGMVLVVPS